MMTYEDAVHRRVHARRNVAFAVNLCWQDAVFACRLVNISPGGARLHLEKNWQAAEEFTLQIEPYGVFPCRNVWQKGMDIGVKFLAGEDVMGEVVAAMAIYG